MYRMFVRMRMQQLILLIMIYFGTVASLMANEYTATIGKTLENGKLFIHPIVSSSQQETLRYELVSAKQGKSGRSQTSQSGNVLTEPRQPTMLSTLRLGVDDADQYTIILRIYADNNLVATDEVQHP